MNILIFTTAFYPSVGGLEKQTLSLIYEFYKKGHTIKVVAMQSTLTNVKHLELEQRGVEIFYNPGLFKKIALFIWCNILFMPNVSLKGFEFLLFRPFKKWIISHNDFYLANNRSSQTKMKLFLIKFASKNISVSRSVANYINTQSCIVYNCYDDEIFKIYGDEEKKYHFVFLGRLVSQKGCDLLIKCCKNLDSNFSLNIIGDGPERDELKKLVKDLRLEKNIRFLGILEGEALARCLNNHHTMVIPSVEEEGFGIVALEGLACGCKIIAANAGGLPEAVNGFGKMFEMGDTLRLEELLKSDLEEAKTYTSHQNSEELQHYLAGQNKEMVAEKYLEIFS